MTQRFAGKVAVVTGAGCVGPGWGNGRAIAVGLAREGAVVIGLDRNAESMAETAERIAAEGGALPPRRSSTSPTMPRSRGPSPTSPRRMAASTCW